MRLCLCCTHNLCAFQIAIFITGGLAIVLAPWPSPKQTQYDASHRGMALLSVSYYVEVEFFGSRFEEKNSEKKLLLLKKLREIVNPTTSCLSIEWWRLPFRDDNIISLSTKQTYAFKFIRSEGDTISLWCLKSYFKGLDHIF